MRKEFDDLYVKDCNGGCWCWVGARCKRTGYGRFRHESAHRTAWRLAYGEIPSGMLIDHVCHNPSCVNPEHLRLATTADNSRNRLVAMGTTSGVKGVHRHGDAGKWKAQIRVDRKLKYLGTFNTIEEAKVAYDDAARIYFGEFHHSGVCDGHIPYIPRAMRKLISEQDVIQLRENGFTYSKISASLSISIATISKILSRVGLNGWIDGIDRREKSKRTTNQPTATNGQS